MKDHSVIFGEDGKICMNAEVEQRRTLLQMSNEISELLEVANKHLMEINCVMLGVIECQDKSEESSTCLMNEMRNNVVELKRMIEMIKTLEQWVS